MVFQVIWYEYDIDVQKEKKCCAIVLDYQSLMVRINEIRKVNGTLISVINAEKEL